jgi:tape measure domain-containing protein
MALELGTLQVDINADVSSLERANRRVSTIGGEISSTFSRVGAVIAAAVSVESARRILNLADNMLVLDTRLRMATKSSQEYSRAQKELLRISNETGQALSETVGLFEQLSIASAALGATNDELITLTETVQKLGALGGSSADAISNSLRQLGQGLAGGVIRAEEFNSILENTPLIAQEIEKRLGYLPGQLRNAVNEGKVLSEDVFQALLEASDEVNERFEKTPFTIAQAFNKLNNNFSVSIGLINRITGSTNDIATSISGIADNVETVILGAFENIAAFSEEIKLNFGIIFDSSKETANELVIWTDVLDNFKNVLGFITQSFTNLPVNLRAVFTIIAGEIDQFVIRFKTGFKLIFLDAEIQAREFLNSGAIRDIANFFEKITGTNVTAGNQEAINALRERSLAIQEGARISIDASQSVIDETLKETEELKRLWSEQAQAKRQSIRDQIDAARSGQEINKRVNTETVSNDKSANEQKLTNEQIFNQTSSALASTRLAESRRFAIIEAGIAFALNLANSAKTGFPQNLPAIAGAFAQITRIKGLLSGGGRQFGGNVSPVLAHPVNEGGIPEMIEQGGKQFLLPNGKGGKITPIGGAASSGGMPQVTVINNGTPQEVESVRMSDGQLMVVMDDKVNAMKSEINNSLATGRGDTAKSVRQGFKLERNL